MNQEETKVSEMNKLSDNEINKSILQLNFVVIEILGTREMRYY